jgi:hypothetical protein
MSAPIPDLVARKRAAELLRHFGAGLITNDRMEDSFPRSQDWSIGNMFTVGVWPLYDDMHEHKLTGVYRLKGDRRTFYARLLLFLTTDFPYRWPRLQYWRLIYTLPIAVVTFGCVRLGLADFQSSGGDCSVWPFFSRSEYEEALKRPPYLRARQAI